MIRSLLFLAALLALGSAARAERIMLTSVNAFRRVADDTLRLDVSLSAPFDFDDSDQLQIQIKQTDAQGMRRLLQMHFGEFGTFDATDQTVQVDHFLWDRQTFLGRESVRRPVSFDGIDLSFAIARADAEFAMADWTTWVQLIPNGGDAQNWNVVSHLPEPSALALAAIGLVALALHLRRLPRLRQRRGVRCLGQQSHHV